MKRKNAHNSMFDLELYVPRNRAHKRAFQAAETL